MSDDATAAAARTLQHVVGEHAAEEDGPRQPAGAHERCSGRRRARRSDRVVARGHDECWGIWDEK